MADCHSCDAGVLWATTEAGKRIPLDPQPRTDGTFYLRPRHPEGVTAIAVKDADREAIAAAHQLYVTHFATCPHASRHRRSR